MASASAKPNWRDSIISQIQTRDQSQRAPYTDLIVFHNHIFESWNTVKNKNKQLLVENELLRLKGPGDGIALSSAESEELKELKEKLLRQTHELAELHKTRGEKANLIVNLNEKVRELETTLETRNERIAELLKQESLIRQEIDGYKLRQDQMEAKFQLLKDENQALQFTNTHLEDKLRKAQKENYEMIERLKEYKSRDAEKMNQENENYLRKRNALVQKELAEAARDMRGPQDDGGIGVGVDALALNPGFENLPNTPYISWDAHDGEVNSVQFSPGTECLLATGGTDRMVKLWDTTRGQADLRCQMVGSNKGIMSVNFDSSGTLVLGTSADGAIRVWGVMDQRPRNSLTGHSSKVLAAKFFLEQSKVVSGSHDRTIKFWDLTKHACVETRFANSCCNDLVVSDSSARTVISGHFDKTVKFWDNRVQSGSNCNIPVQEINLGAKVTSLSLSNDGKRLMACVRDDSLKIVDLRMTQIIKNLVAEGFVACNDWTRASFSADCEYAGVGSQDGTIYIWNTLTGKLEKSLKQHQNAVIAVCWHPFANQYLASVDKNKKAIIWSSI